MLRVVLAVLLGGLVGWEREHSNHSAGLRTHILVCVGSALIMLLSMYGFSQFANQDNVMMDPARLSAQVISGIGFLGAGAILRNGLSVSGLTTAASLWVIAAIGLSVGAGFYLASILVTLVVFLVLWILNRMEQRFFKSKQAHKITLRVKFEQDIIERIQDALGAQGIAIRRLEMEEEWEDGWIRVHYWLSSPLKGWVYSATQLLGGFGEIESVAFNSKKPFMKGRKLDM